MNESAAAGVGTKSQLENYYRWDEPDSDITVCLEFDTVDRLQLEVLCGIDSSSDAGNEVGGILLGRTELDEGRTLTFVDDFEPFPCEHRIGPSYALTAEDLLNFEAALARGSARETLSVVGYYRSHNRDGLFLSSDDLRLIQRHFREPHNLFLLIKTMPNGACTAGFFFWKNGHIRSEFTDSEAPLIPISLSSAGRRLSLRKAVDDTRVAPPASVLPVREGPPATASPQLGRSRDLHRRLIGGIVVTGVAAAVTVAVVRYREAGPAQAVPKSAPAASTPVRLPSPVVKQSAPIISSPPETIVRQAQNRPAAPPRNETRPTIPAPAAEMPPVRSPVASEPSTPPSPMPLTAAIERPPSPAAPSPKPTAPLAGRRQLAGKRQLARVDVKTLPREANVKPLQREPDSDVVPRKTVDLPVFSPAKPLERVHPEFPPWLRRATSTQMSVILRVQVRADGKVANVTPALNNRAAPNYTNLAAGAARNWTFEPAHYGNRAIASEVQLEFRFLPDASTEPR